MPTRPPILKRPGVPSLTERRRDYDRRRRTVARGYDWQWRRAREFYLTSHVFCECDEHQGKDTGVLAEVVDHRIPIAKAPHLRLEPSNFVAMSKRCHDRHTARTHGLGRRGESSRYR
jgi:5-methylcytosine-specific restriction protein A